MAHELLRKSPLKLNPMRIAIRDSDIMFVCLLLSLEGYLNSSSPSRHCAKYALIQSWHERGRWPESYNPLITQPRSTEIQNVAHFVTRPTRAKLTSPSTRWTCSLPYKAVCRPGQAINYPLDQNKAA